jgi:crotonobetainyl-CoA:carnitine CoA-transferase CaiB-like acyl-CoA transferase
MIRVLDFSQVLSGPFATMLLADGGAEVIKVEHPTQGDVTRHWGPPFLADQSLYFLAFNRGKKSLTLDLHDPRDQAIARQWAHRADVVVENFRPGVMARFGLDDHSLRRDHPGLIYAAIRGYRPTSARAADGAVEVVLEAEAGLMAMTGDPDGREPVRLSVAAIDMMAGVFLVARVFEALYRREQTGMGETVIVYLGEVAQLMMTHPWLLALNADYDYPRMGSRHPNIAPYEAFVTRDRPLILGAMNDAQFQQLSKALGYPQWADDPRWKTNADRVRDRERLHQAIEAILRERSASEWQTVFTRAGVLCAVVHTPRAAAQAWLASAVPKLTAHHPRCGPLTWPTSPFRPEGGEVLPPPELGQHNLDCDPF